ncbi:MoaD/ThiS family protein [Tomitella fengzijianii]|uniref:MoaD/ThiS family protein n=1 Tax=Tomitella fengzijianii TaxID=2597660 RepID=A0A516X1R4_9ACTN|nr:MoaD/ThiS family protein [Tomitella fengzijianii]QDQ96970.1 MoaD/ThiS family protein [Tomitella fengzijianii]
MSAPTISIRYFAGAASAAGRDEELITSPSPSPSLDGVLEHLAAVRPAVSEVLNRCSFLWGGVAVRDRHAPLHLPPEGGTLDILPPFAGG